MDQIYFPAGELTSLAQTPSWICGKKKGKTGKLGGKRKRKDERERKDEGTGNG